MRYVHTTIFTGHFEESIEFYQKHAGLSVLRDMRGNPDHAIVFMGNPEGGACIELVKSDAEAEYKKKKEAGLAPGEMVMPNPAAKFFCVKDPNGIEVQFLQEDIY